MSLDPVAASLAVQLARAEAGSARPHAPVLPDAEPAAPRLASSRTHVAGRLHALARWVEPRPRRTCQTG